MTLQNLKYIVEIEKHRSFSKAAQALYMSQSTLSASVKELEEELGIQIFIRTNRGVIPTHEGEDCIRYAKDILERSDLLSLRYQNLKSADSHFSVSTQRLPFAVRAFTELERQLKGEYDIAVRETSTSGVVYDVSTNKSEVGILAVPQEHLNLMLRSLDSYGLAFTKISELSTYVFLRRQHPLASRSSLTLDDVKDFPFVTYDQDDAPGYYTEETLLFKRLPRAIHVCDRATKMYLVRNSDAYSIGVDLPNFNRDEYFQDSNTELTAIPLADNTSRVDAGYIMQKDRRLSETGEEYVRILRSHIETLHLPAQGS